MRIADVEKRAFYERAAVEATWTLQQMSRQINTFYYERIATSKDKDRAKHLLAKAPRQNAVEEPMKDPYVFEFLGQVTTRKMRDSGILNSGPLLTIWDEKCGAIDVLVAEKAALIADLEAYRKSLIFEVVTGKKPVSADELLRRDQEVA